LEETLFIPNLIVQTEYGRRSLLFFLHGDYDVYCFNHSKEELRDFTNKETTILWEPSERKDPVLYSFI
jgi:hypothetical protein